MQSSLDGMVFAQGTKLQNTQPTYLHKNNLYSDWFIKECHLGETMWAGYSAIAPHEVTDDITFLKKWQVPCALICQCCIILQEGCPHYFFHFILPTILAQ